MKREAITPCGEHTAAVSGSGRSVGRRGAVAPGSAWALVTGAGSGIGRCYALRLAALGYNLVLAGNRREPLETVCGEILAAGAGPDGGVRKAASPAAGFRPEVRIVEIDLARIEAAAELWEAVRREGAAIDVLVNNAGIFSFRDILQTPAERIERIILLHDLTNTQLCRMAAADMVRRGCRGHILNMSSYSLWMPFPGLALYSASKAYLRSFSVAFALAAHRHAPRGAYHGRLVRTARTARPVAGTPVHRPRLVEPRVDSPLQDTADVGAASGPQVHDEISEIGSSSTKKQ